MPPNRPLIHSFFSTLRGDQGEKQVKILLEKRGYQCLHNVLIQRTAKKPIQIDHLVLTSTGLHILETKHYRGHIQGYMTGKVWHQTFPDNNKPNLLPNAFQQNSLHCLVIREKLTKEEHIPIRGHVIFTGSCSLSGDIASRITTLDQLYEQLGDPEINNRFEHVWNALNEIADRDNGNLQKLTFQASLLSCKPVKDS